MNRLKNETSPYLRLHAQNPVDWHPWGDDAFEKARRENKPVFLSIGYSTCHWCHVMARESFDDDEVARLMNGAFVSVKVDREERPDIDRLYMSVCQMMTGTGGWPLTILMTPDRRPFFAATYLPKRTKFGRMGMIELITEIGDIWRRRRDEIYRASSKIMSLIGTAETSETGTQPGEELLASAYAQLARIYDSRHGGFGTAPKFPAPHIILYLLRWWKRTGNERALSMAEHTLTSMRRGGIYDHIGFGFHRYSTDEAWRVPHFEKMIYDQAMISLAYTEAFQATGEKEYAETAREIFTYVLRGMTSPEGAFFTAEDAESEGEEGRFYVWKEEEMKGLLGNSDAAFARNVFNIQAQGNFQDESTGRSHGDNILYMTETPAAIAEKLGMSPPDFEKRLGAVRMKLSAAREERIRPRRDEKILTDWNGLMIASLARASGAFGESSYGRAAAGASHAVLTRMCERDDRLFHCLRNDEGIAANLDDYAFLTWGLIELHQATGDAAYLSRALSLTNAMVRRFEDPRGGFFFTAEDNEAGLMRQKDAYDGAVPSGNSIAAWNLVRLGLMTGNQEFVEKADRAFRAFSKEAERSPAGYTQLLIGLMLALGPSFEVVIAGRHGSPDTEKMRAFLTTGFMPEMMVLFHPSGSDAPLIESLAPFTKGMDMKEGHATAYVCSRGACRLPTTDLREMASLLMVKTPRKSN